MILPTLPLMLIAMNYAVRGVTASLIDTNDKCGLDAVTSQEVNLHIQSKRNATGRWKTTFAVQTDATNNPLDDDGMELNLKQSVIKCREKEFLKVQGVLEQVAEVKKAEPILENKMQEFSNSTTDGEGLEEKHTVQEVKKTEGIFFEKGAKNTEFSNGRRTVRRKTVESDNDYGSAITNRPLKDGELFEVKLDEITTKWNNYITIGLTTVSPATINLPDWIKRMDYHILVYYKTYIHYNKTAVETSYGRNLFELKVGERVGVMRKEEDTLHFYVNGVDQGAVKQKFSGTVYGVVDVNDGAVQATIVNPK